MARKCKRFSNSGGRRHCVSFSSGGKRKARKRGRKRSRRGMRGFEGMSFAALQGDVAKCVRYAQNRAGLWRCLMQSKGPGSPQNRPQSIKRKYRYSTSKARSRRHKTSKLIVRRGKRRGRARR